MELRDPHDPAVEWRCVQGILQWRFVGAHYWNTLSAYIDPWLSTSSLQREVLWALLREGQ